MWCPEYSYNYYRALFDYFAKAKIASQDQIKKSPMYKSHPFHLDTPSDSPAPEEKSMKSNQEEVGEILEQCIQFASGNKKTFKGVIAKSIRQSEFTRFDLTDGRRISVNTKNVDWFESVKIDQSFNLKLAKLPCEKE